MSTATKYATALQQYNQYLMNTQQKVMQERSVHGQELANVYMEAVSNGAPAPYLSMLEAMIVSRLSTASAPMRPGMVQGM